MTREECIKVLQALWRYKDCEYSEKEIRESLSMAIESLEQYSILDKIKAEIEKCYCTVTNDYDHGRNYGLYMTTQIINKYKAESEVEKNE